MAVRSFDALHMAWNADPAEGNATTVEASRLCQSALDCVLESQQGECCGRLNSGFQQGSCTSGSSDAVGSLILRYCPRMNINQLQEEISRLCRGSSVVKQMSLNVSLLLLKDWKGHRTGGGFFFGA